MAAKHFVSATVPLGSLAAGEPVTIRRRVTGGVLSEGVQIWVFAGNYVNVSHVPANADGMFCVQGDKFNQKKKQKILYSMKTAL